MNGEQTTWTRIKDAEDQGDWALCIRLCRDEIAEAQTAPADYSRRVKLKLAYALLEEQRNQRENYESAIAIYQELLSQASKGGQEWCELNKNLGFAFQNRLAGDRDENLLSAARHYEDALSAMGDASDTVLRASICAEIGQALAECKAGERNEIVNHAVLRLRDALGVFDAAHYPEEFDEITRTLRELERESA